MGVILTPNLYKNTQLIPIILTIPFLVLNLPIGDEILLLQIITDYPAQDLKNIKVDTDCTARADCPGLLDAALDIGTELHRKKSGPRPV